MAADAPPPRSTGDERTVLRLLLQYHRASVVRKVEGVTDEDARRSPVPSGTSLLWLLRHLAWAEDIWIGQRVLGGPPPAPVRVSDLATDTVAAAVEGYRAAWARTDAVLGDEAVDLGSRCRDPKGDPTNLRWVLAHLVEETARHAGHADVLRELLDGATGR